ncbi:F-box domain-containing protein [Delitschia confertaspora ATCC 74209]|uniref:F-box domain-containing protein n=1 Tax=Delitschia confertaspora ATCC 74209 TaxID=1513339 RepID=A0A9P4JWC9_9PLEO|nr:F-box domain-containing protein [Delitschia confertaspora ATCC 74209]
MAPGALLQQMSCVDRPSKKIKRSDTAELHSKESEDAAAVLPSHPLGVKPLGNAYTATENIKLRCGAFARLPDELLNHFLETLDGETLVRLGSTCKALYAFTRADDLWRSLFVESSPENFTWHATWRSTYLGIPEEHVSTISCKNLFSDVLYRPFQCANTPLEPFTSNIPQRNQILRLPDLTHEEFSTSYTDTPFILTSPVKEWPIYGQWTPETLLSKYPSVKFRAEAVDWPLETYMSYTSNNTDESPLYLFDRAFVEKTSITVGRDEPNSSYWSPDCFGDDLFHVLGSQRPDHRWMIMGPKRSGSTFHKDPNATSAWNAVLTGSKYWLMFPSRPGVEPPPGIILSEDQSEITSPLSIAEYLLTFHAEARRTPGCREGICYAGEVLHVPSGWFHLVLNLGDSLALTQNFVPRKRLGDVLSFLRDQSENISGFKDDVEDAFGLFTEKLRKKDPELLEEGLKELEKKAKKGRGKWEELTKPKEEEESGGGFSFGFGFGGDDDDAEIP